VVVGLVLVVGNVTTDEVVCEGSTSVVRVGVDTMDDDGETVDAMDDGEAVDTADDEAVEVG